MEVSAPQIYEKMTSVLEFWGLKAERAGGRPFQADVDIHVAALDIIMAVAFDFSLQDTTILRHVNELKKDVQRHLESEKSQDEPVEFFQVRSSPELEACTYLTHSIGVGFQSPVPRLAHWWYLQSKQTQKTWLVC